MSRADKEISDYLKTVRRSGSFILTSSKGDVIAQLRRMIAAEERAPRPIRMSRVPLIGKVPCNDSGVAP